MKKLISTCAWCPTASRRYTRALVDKNEIYMSKVLSIIPTIISAILSYQYFNSPDDRGNFIIYFLFLIVLPVSMIWFPQAYAGKTNWFFGRLSSEKTFIVLFGWLLLMIPTIAMFVLVYRLV